MITARMFFIRSKRRERDIVKKKSLIYCNDIRANIEHRRKRIGLLFDKYQSSILSSSFAFTQNAANKQLVYIQVQTWWRLSNSKFLIRISAIFWSIIATDESSSIDLALWLSKV
jgi:hypothetical protein